MYIGIMLDAYTGDHWYRIEEDFDSVKAAMKSIKLPLPIAAIFDSSKNDLVELHEKYREHRTELLEKASNIYEDHLLEHRKDPGKKLRCLVHHETS